MRSKSISDRERLAVICVCLQTFKPCLHHGEIESIGSKKQTIKQTNNHPALSSRARSAPRPEDHLSADVRTAEHGPRAEGKQ